MQMMPIESNAVRAVGYNSQTRTLRVQFPNGKSYDYQDVPREKFDGLLASESFGTAFHTIKREHTAAIVEPKTSTE